PFFPSGTEDFRQTLQLAKKGDAEAQHKLGLFYERGEQVPRNYVEAAKWFRKAADQEHSEAMMSLGRQYENGYGAFERNYAEAAKWYYRAAMLGDDYGANSMGRTYLHGIGVEKDPIRAYVWFSQRKVWKDEYPKAIEVKLTKEQLRQAELEANKLREEIRTNREAAERR
ncbi:MAG: tetratricopeptide repeat protein, partial [Candidatus Binatia bacterium]